MIFRERPRKGVDLRHTGKMERQLLLPYGGREGKVLRMPMRFKPEYWDDRGAIQVNMELLGIEYCLLSIPQKQVEN